MTGFQEYITFHYKPDYPSTIYMFHNIPSTPSVISEGEMVVVIRKFHISLTILNEQYQQSSSWNVVTPFLFHLCDFTSCFCFKSSHQKPVQLDEMNWRWSAKSHIKRYRRQVYCFKSSYLHLVSSSATVCWVSPLFLSLAPVWLFSSHNHYHPLHHPLLQSCYLHRCQSHLRQTFLRFLYLINWMQMTRKNLITKLRADQVKHYCYNRSIWKSHCT